MNNKVKIFEIALALVMLVGIGSIPFTFSNQTASVLSVFSSDNINAIVLQAQTKLKELGFYNGNLSGLFGWKTKFAIYRFQEVVGLNQNGILDIPTQRALFYVAPEIEYLEISNTKEGDKFLEAWIMKEYGNEGKFIELTGLLSLSEEEIFHQNDPIKFDFLLISKDTKYALKNISNESIDDFVGKNVSIKGFVLEKENNLGLQSVVINHLTQI